MPIPADTIVGLYHPWRDSLAPDYPNGVPFKNFLVTDPVRQHYPWRQLSIKELFSGHLPLWNPYSLAGVPLAGNMQSAPYYPLNLIYLVTDFSTGWGLQIVLQIVLGGIFMAMFLRQKDLRAEAITLGVLAWVGSGFFIAWLELNSLVQAVIWLPLILLSLDKISEGKRWWATVSILALTCSFLAGASQVFLYVLLASTTYAFWTKTLKWFALITIVTVVLTFPQWKPALIFFANGLRSVGASAWQEPGWFLPWQNLAQFIAPDYFGNPATMNYFGIWNYMEFIAYIGIIPLFFVVSCLLRPNKKVGFYLFWVVFGLVVSLPSFVSELPFRFHLPLISAAQPTRIIVLIDFSLAVLAAFGLDQFLRGNRSKKHLAICIGIFVWTLIVLLIVAIATNNQVSLRNLFFPLIIFGVSVIAICIRPSKGTILVLLLMTVFDLYRFGSKFESFSPREWLFPQTRTIEFLQKATIDGSFRIAAVDDRILPPNFGVMYGLQVISGYDSIFPQKTAEFIMKMEDIKKINRILVPKNYDSEYFDLLGVKYVLSLDPIKSGKYHLIFEEGQTKVYENKNVFPRAFFDESTNQGTAIIQKYSPSEVIIKTENASPGRLVLTDSFYPGWQASIDGKTTKISLARDIFRGITVPAGKHLVRFYL